MERIFVDPHMFSEEWFQERLDELIKSKKTQFLFSNSEVGLDELGKVRQALNFKKTMFSVKKGIQASLEDVEAHIAIISAHGPFATCSACDDAHIFAAIYLHPTKYVFSCDHRMARCRDTISGTIDRRYLAFAVISDERAYLVARPRLV